MPDSEPTPPTRPGDGDAAAVSLADGGSLVSGRGPLLALFGVSLLIALAVGFPLSVALRFLPEAGQSLTGRPAGTVWAGRLLDAHVGSAALGDVEVALSPWSLAVGALRVSIRLERPAPGRLVLVRRAGRTGIEDASGQAPVAVLGLGWAKEGAIDIDRAAASFAGGVCETAQGRVATDVLQQAAPVGGWTGPRLVGDLRCVDGVLTASLSGANPGAAVGAVVRFPGQGRYRLELRVRPAGEPIASMLTGAGFTASPDGYLRVDEGRLR